MPRDDNPLPTSAMSNQVVFVTGANGGIGASMIDIFASYACVGVPERALNLLAVILLAAAAGVASGLWWPILGVLTAGGLVCFFLVAVVLHIRTATTAISSTHSYSQAWPLP
jgi:NAD(P)-dependent dehydrogenase (short-subunit alcohol dehydrogenase family)